MNENNYSQSDPLNQGAGLNPNATTDATPVCSRSGGKQSLPSDTAAPLLSKKNITPPFIMFRPKVAKFLDMESALVLASIETAGGRLPHNGPNGSFFYAHSDIKKDTLLSISTIKRRLELLVKIGLITQDLYYPNEYPNFYKVTIPTQFTENLPQSTQSTGVAHTESATSSHRAPTNNNTKNTTKKEKTVASQPAKRMIVQEKTGAPSTRLWQHWQEQGALSGDYNTAQLGRRGGLFNKNMSEFVAMYTEPVVEKMIELWFTSPMFRDERRKGGANYFGYFVTGHTKIAKSAEDVLRSQQATKCGVFCELDESWYKDKQERIEELQRLDTNYSEDTEMRTEKLNELKKLWRSEDEK